MQGSSIYYDRFNKLPKFDDNGDVINPGVAFGIDGLSALISEKIFGSKYKVLKLLFSSSLPFAHADQ